MEDDKRNEPRTGTVKGAKIKAEGGRDAAAKPESVEGGRVVVKRAQKKKKAGTRTEEKNRKVSRRGRRSRKPMEGRKTIGGDHRGTKKSSVKAIADR